jgi:hypothetical protein
MNNAIGLGIFALGIILLIFSFNESHSLRTEITRLFTGSAAEEPVWLIFGGAFAVLAGLAMAIIGTRRATDNKKPQVLNLGIWHRRWNRSLAVQNNV